MIKKEASNKIALIQSFCCILVVFIHSTGYKYFNLGSSSLDFFTKLIIDSFVKWIPQVSVSCFFLISGFLFFKGFNEKHFDLNLYKRKIKKRILSIVVPYFICNLIWMLFNMLIQQFPAIVNNISSLPMFDWNFNSFINGLLMGSYSGITWYLRYLFYFFLISPLIWLALTKNKVTRYTFITFAFFCSTVFENGLNRFNSLFFFSIGALFNFYAFDYINYGYSDKQIRLANVCNVLCIFLFSIINDDGMICCLLRLLNIICIWISFDKINIKRNNNFAKFSMFIYLYHGQTQQCINKLFQIIFSQCSLHWAAALINTFGGVMLTILFLVTVGYYLEKKCNMIWNILVGYR